jgi:hypothetical protein
VVWQRSRRTKYYHPLIAPRRRQVVRHSEGAGKILSVVFFSGLVTQSEIDDLLDLLYGSYGERLLVSYKEAS